MTMKECKKCNGDGYSYEDGRQTPTRCECQNSHCVSSAGSLVVWIPFRDADGTLDVSEATKFEMCADDMLNDGWRWIKFNEENTRT